MGKEWVVSGWSVGRVGPIALSAEYSAEYFCLILDILGFGRIPAILQDYLVLCNAKYSVEHLILSTF